MLASIVETKHAELAALTARREVIERGANHAPEVRDFAQALRANPGRVALIAECKRRSPGAGPIRPGLDPVELTRGYEAAGAAALSVLTDRDYFGGSREDLEAIRAETTIPILRKDFTLDPLHVLEARSMGADAVLLIVRILSDAQLRLLYDEAVGLGMDVLVETHDADELERAVALGAEVIGINNRDLAHFTTDLGTTMRLMEQLPEDVVVVSESGIKTVDDVQRLGEGGVDAVLVGETLLRAEVPADSASALSSVSRTPR